MEPVQKQQELMKLQYLQKHIEQISQKTQEMNQQLLDITISINALHTLSETKVGTSILTQVANGIFVPTTLENNVKLVVNIGADTTVEKTIPQVIAMLEEQEKSMQKNLKEAEEVLEHFGNEAMMQISSLEQEE